jgi:hypothetical protein
MVASITQSMRIPAPVALAAALMLASCVAFPPPGPVAPTPPEPEGPSPTPFSTATSLEGLPAGWHPYRLSRFKKYTSYKLADTPDAGVVVESFADASASGLEFRTSFDVHEYPWLTWTWKVPKMIEGSRNSLAHIEDTPARVVVTFEGGRDKLPPAEQMNYDLAKALAGATLPYATLMYVWDDNLPYGSVVQHNMTTRVKSIVVGSKAKLGTWVEERHNLLNDYRRAFHEDPPKANAVGFMTDSDNSATVARAFFGDIRLHRQGPDTASAELADSKP